MKLPRRLLVKALALALPLMLGACDRNKPKGGSAELRRPDPVFTRGEGASGGGAAGSSGRVSQSRQDARAAPAGTTGGASHRSASILPASSSADGQGSMWAEDERRLLFAQIVEDDEPNAFNESAIIEGEAYKYILASLKDVTHDGLRKTTNNDVSYDKLMQTPGLYRGHVVTLGRAVVLETPGPAELPPEYKLPGFTVLPCVLVDSARDIYALRILCRPGSKLYEKLQKGIADDALPVLRMSGYFFKLYARKTNDPAEAPWRAPLLVCTEPEFAQAVSPRRYMEEMASANLMRLLPSERLEAPGARERLVLVASGNTGGVPARKYVGRQEVSGDLGSFLSLSADVFKKRLPAEQAEFPAAVILKEGSAAGTNIDEIVKAMRDAGFQRIAIKQEPATPATAQK